MTPLKTGPQAGTFTHQLAMTATEDMERLAGIAVMAPPSVQQILERVLSTMQQLAIHVHATLDEGGECLGRIEDRVNETASEVKTLQHGHHHDSQVGHILQHIFQREPHAAGSLTS